MQLSTLQKQLDEVQCSKDGHAGAAAGSGAGQDEGASARRSAMGGDGGVVVPCSPGVWLSATESKVSLALNLALAVVLALVLLQPRRRQKTSRDLQ